MFPFTHFPKGKLVVSYIFLPRLDRELIWKIYNINIPWQTWQQLNSKVYGRACPENIGIFFVSSLFEKYSVRFSLRIRHSLINTWLGSRSTHFRSRFHWSGWQTACYCPMNKPRQTSTIFHNGNRPFQTFLIRQPSTWTTASAIRFQQLQPGTAEKVNESPPELLSGCARLSDCWQPFTMR